MGETGQAREFMSCLKRGDATQPQLDVAICKHRMHSHSWNMEQQQPCMEKSRALLHGTEEASQDASMIEAMH